MTDIDSILMASRTHRKAVEAFLGFACLHPCPDDVQPLLEALAESVRLSFDDLSVCLTRISPSTISEAACE
jgi:hypothetical protein